MTRWIVRATLMVAAVGLLCMVSSTLARSDEGDRPIGQGIMVLASASPVTGGEAFDLTVGLDANASANTTVSVSTDEPGVFTDLPSSVVVQQGTSQTTVTVHTTTVSSTVTATITGSATGCTSGQTVLDVEP